MKRPKITLSKGGTKERKRLESKTGLRAACETLRSAMIHLQEFDRLPDDTCPADLIDYLSAALKKAMGKEGV